MASTLCQTNWRLFCQKSSESYCNSRDYVCLCVVVSLNYSFIFAPIVTKFGYPTHSKGKFDGGVDLGSQVPDGTPGVQNIATKLSPKNRWCKLRMMMTFMEVKGQQRSSIVNYALWLPNLVKRTADASWGRWWPSQRSKVNRDQIW